MRFTVIGHAALHFDVAGTTILVDPWLAGSAFWRSWWHFPPSPDARSEWLAPDFVYLTHHHFDHFHYPSMRRIDRRTTVLIPKFGVDVMRGEVEGLGFANVRELPHGEVVELAPGVRVASYQYGPDDSLFAVAGDGAVVVDVNDCKIRGRALQAVRDAFGDVDVMLKSHSWAQAYPFCYEADDPADLHLIERETYHRDFVAIARELQPRYAVPFGSMVAFLHPESRHVNEQLITPDEIASVCAPALQDINCTIVTVAPGDTWDSRTGFDRAEHDWYAQRPKYLAAMEEAVEQKVAEQTAAESARTVTFDAFSGYFEPFLHALPRVVWRRAIARPIVFEVPSADAPYFVLDFARRQVRAERRLPADRAAVVHVTEGLLADAIDKRIVHLVHGAVRVRVALAPGGSREDTAFWLLLMVWELGYLPPSHLARPRMLGVAWRRRAEAFGYLHMARRGKGSLTERMVEGFASGSEEPLDPLRERRRSPAGE